MLKAELEGKSRDFTIWWDPGLHTRYAGACSRHQGHLPGPAVDPDSYS